MEDAAVQRLRIFLNSVVPYWNLSGMHVWHFSGENEGRVTNVRRFQNFLSMNLFSTQNRFDTMSSTYTDHDSTLFNTHVKVGIHVYDINRSMFLV